ncbi:receptor-type tyrosine-protein phosphatase T-like [Liolophura sinensis]|uniref:receptor-type tyrosine-protein phosphatase T-like n=1 Tax=Liolophura sinensis TaxID=3198878 RepID=UPI00315892F8
MAVCTWSLTRYLLLFSVLFLVIHAQIITKNVAYSKPTFQSSTLRSLGTMYVGSKAVDADRTWPACSHSEREQNPYWTVDLVLPTTVYDARVVNRDDCCQDQLKGFRVFVSNSRDLASATLCYMSPNWPTPGVTVDFSCTTPVIGRYVSIVLPGLASLALCDVAIYGGMGQGGRIVWVYQLCAEANHATSPKCADYTFGKDCVGECHCKNEMEVCDKRSGTCKSGSCPDFKFGIDCKQKCQCQRYNEACNKVTGFCQSGCLAGLGGVGCQSACEDLTFGSNCEGQCRCLDNSEVCDKITGACATGCAPGWTGSDCTTACAGGTYGIMCRGRCRCSDPSEVCDTTTGFCASGCAPGWTGNRCHVECPNGYFGARCKEKCNCYDASEVCDKATGTCLSGCAGDSRGEGCSECPFGRFGTACEMECRCRNTSEHCARATGFCLSGCEGMPDSKTCLVPVRVNQIFTLFPESRQGLPAEAVGGIIGGIVAVLLVLMVAILICLSQRNSKKANRARNSLYENFGPNFLEAQAVPNSSCDQQSAYENVEVLYENCGEVTPSSDAMDTDELFDYVQGFLADPESLEAAFKEIPIPLATSNEALQPWNLKKNRYRHVLPFDGCRVLLQQPEGEEQTDYINASYIDGYQKPRAYIATQGPTPVMIDDFWKMVWQEKCGKIVMLTNLLETGRRKCDQYWPDAGSQIYGDIEVEYLSTEDFAYFTVRSFKLTKGTDVKTVTQFHFRNWSDHDAPDDTTGILHFRDKIRDTNVETDGPTVVHCSAGVGRTGTYIALDILIEQAQKVGVLDIDNCILKLRKQRMHMIQNPTQYEFLHKALRDAILCTNSSISAGKFLEDSLTDTAGTQTRIASEFLALGKFQALENRKKETVSEKKSKNRSDDIIASDFHRVFLSTNVPDRTNYINAIFVPCDITSDATILE